MSEIKYAQSRVIGERELRDRPGRPSQILREAEATLIGELARSVALSDRRFVDWPQVELVADDGPALWPRAWRLVATVEAR